MKVLVDNGAIQVMSEERYKQLVTEVEQTSEDDLEVMQRAGFK